METTTRLAYERTFLSHENTQMAWVRTSLTLISFGFTMAKFFMFLNDHDGLPSPWLGARTVGLMMICLGVLFLLASGHLHRRAVKSMRDQCPELPPSLAGTMGNVLTAFGVLALVGVFIRN